MEIFSFPPEAYSTTLQQPQKKPLNRQEWDISSKGLEQLKGTAAQMEAAEWVHGMRGSMQGLQSRYKMIHAACMIKEG